jgi:RNA polymerase sigma-70 factor (ECF subfamily)
VRTGLIGRDDNEALSDLEVVQAVQGGETEVFEVLVSRYRQPAYRIAYYYLHDEEEARDIMQEAFLLAFKSIKSFRGDAKFSTWFIRIVINLSLNKIRKSRFQSLWRKKEPRNSGESLADLEEEIQHIPDKRLDPEQQLIRKEMGSKIRQAVDLLPDKQKIVFILKHMEGFSIKEICEVTHMVEGTVKSYLSRAALKIQEVLEKSYEKPKQR